MLSLYCNQFLSFIPMEKRIKKFWIAGFFLPAINATVISLEFLSTSVRSILFLGFGAFLCWKGNKRLKICVPNLSNAEAKRKKKFVTAEIFIFSKPKIIFLDIFDILNKIVVILYICSACKSSNFFQLEISHVFHGPRAENQQRCTVPNLTS